MSHSLKALVAISAVAVAPAFAATTSSFDGGAHDVVESAAGVYISAPSFTDKFWFTVGDTSELASETSYVGITNGTYSLYDGADNQVASWALGTGVNVANVLAGTYYYAVTGSASSLGFYSLGSTVSAVPEAETYAMMLAGLGALGFLASRRRG